MTRRKLLCPRNARMAVGCPDSLVIGLTIKYLIEYHSDLLLSYLFTNKTMFCLSVPNRPSPSEPREINDWKSVIWSFHRLRNFSFCHDS